MELLQLTSLLPLIIIVHLYILSPAVCYRNYTALAAIVFTEMPPVDDNVHSEYYFGRCTVSEKTLYKRVNLTYEDIKGRMIVRQWLHVSEELDCIYIRATSAYADIVKYHAFKFNICVCRIVYNYGGYLYIYRFFEWYIPVEMRRHIEWQLMFYGPWKGMEELSIANYNYTEDY